MFSENGGPRRVGVAIGDLLGSGTISGTTRESLGSLLEMTMNGRDPIALQGGGQRGFLEDGDTVTISGWCKGAYRIGFGGGNGQIVLAVRVGL